MNSGDFIYSRLFAWRGAFGVVDDELDGCYVSNEFPTFLPDPDQIDLKYLFYWFRLSTTLDAVEEKCTGSTPLTRNRFKERHFLDLEIPLPPLDEQRRIVARIEELSAKIDEARRLSDLAIQLQGEFLAAEEMRVWPESCLDSAPSLAELTSYLARGRQSKQGESCDFLIKTQHVQMGYLIPTTLTLASEVAAKVKEDAYVQHRDILIACSAAGCLGRVAQYLENGRRNTTDTHIAIARADTRLVIPEYLFAYLRSARGQHELRRRERGDWQREKIGFRLTELNLGDLRRVPVPLPSLERQQKILDNITSLYARNNAIQDVRRRARRELDVLLPSVLNAAFNCDL